VRKIILLITLSLTTFLTVDTFAQEFPLVYDVENTCADCPIPYLPSIGELPIIQSLPDPFEWSDGRGRISNFSDWRHRRAEIGAEIQNYEIGKKPVRADSITASYIDDTLRVNITVNGYTLTLTSAIILPDGSGPFPAVIGMNSPSGFLPPNIFTSRNIAQITYSHNQVTAYGNPRITDPYFRLYPEFDLNNTGQYSAWAWGVSRLIDGLELVQADLPIDLQHIAVAGCSYAGKMALFSGAFDERIALTLAQESGGGGATSWRYSHSEPNGTVEKIDNTDYNWFKNSMNQFAGNSVWRMPEDHHELMSMVAPRVLFVTANPDYTWLSNPSCHVCSNACKEVYNALGITERFGYSIVGGHSHCSIPNSQLPELEAFVDKFLLGDTAANTNVLTTPYNIDLSPWITWDTPALANDSSYFGKTSLVTPADYQSGLDTMITFKWLSVNDAQMYFIQLSLDPTFLNVAVTDSTIDTLKVFTGLLEGKVYYWRVQVESAQGSGPWSNVGHFSTAISLPSAPELISAEPYPNRPGWFTFTWKRTENADQYLLQTSMYEAFTTIFQWATTADTFKIMMQFQETQEYYWRVQASNIAGNGPWSEIWKFNSPVGVNEIEGIPTEYSLSQNYPNPFNPSTKIIFALPQASLTKIIIYNLLGEEVQTLIDKELEAGYYEINFDASNFQSGVYFYRIQSGDFISTKKMILMK